MTEDRNRQWLLQSRPTAALTGSEFRLNEGPVPRPADGQVLGTGIYGYRSTRPSAAGCRATPTFPWFR